MIKTNAVSARTVLIKQTYPCLKRNTINGMIVLFSTNTCGVVVAIEKIDSLFINGYRSEQWIPKDFQPWYGTITLTSEPESAQA